MRQQLDGYGSREARDTVGFIEWSSARFASGRMMRVVGLIFCFGFLQLCSAHGITCTVTQEAGRTRYSVPEFTATNCHYRWTNITNHVLANHQAKIDELVVMKSNRSLLTNGCSERIHYMRDCISEGMPREANCTINCSGNAGPQDVEEPPPTPETKPTPLRAGITRNHWVAVAVAFASTVALLLVVLFLVCSCRNTQMP